MQKLTVNLPLYSVEVTAEHETTLIKKAAFWLSLPVRCPHCERPLILNYRNPQKFDYYELRCVGGDVVHSVNLGEARETHDLYFDAKKSWTTRPVGDRGDEPEPRPTPQPALGSRANEPAPVDDAKAAVAGKRNALIRAIMDCKAAGLRTGITPADVKDLDDEQLDAESFRLGDMLLNARSTPPAQE